MPQRPTSRLVAILVALVGASICASVPGCSGRAGSPEGGAQSQDKFFIAVGSGDPQRVLDVMHPELQQQIDKPLLADWMRQVNTSLGEYKGMSWTDWNTSWKVENGVQRMEAKGTFNFDKGSAQADFVYVDDRLVSFNVKSEKLAGDWFRGPSDATLYRQRGAQFLEHLYQREFDEAYALTDRRFRDAVKREVLEHAADEMQSVLGAVQKIEYDDRQWLDEGSGRLAIYYRVEGDRVADGVNGFRYARVNFAFEGLQGFLAEFNNVANATIELSPGQGKPYEQRENEVIDALAAKDAARLLAALDELVRRKIDEPVLSAWLGSVAANQGDFRQVKSIERRTLYADGRKTTQSNCVLQFSKGDVGLQLEFVDLVPDHAMGFSIDTAALAGWTDRLDAATYQDAGRTFLVKWLDGDAAAAFALMGGPLQDAVPLERLTAVQQSVVGDLGAIQSVEPGPAEVAAGENLELLVPCKLVGEKKQTSATVRFVFTGSAFLLNGFDIEPVE